jgi:hypothetical protein
MYETNIAGDSPGGDRSEGGRDPRNGPAINFLTESARCDSLSKVPFHKYVRVRLRPVGVGEEAEVGEIRESALVEA